MDEFKYQRNCVRVFSVTNTQKPMEANCEIRIGTRQKLIDSDHKLKDDGIDSFPK